MSAGPPSENTLGCVCLERGSRGAIKAATGDSGESCKETSRPVAMKTLGHKQAVGSKNLLTALGLKQAGERRVVRYVASWMLVG